MKKYDLIIIGAGTAGISAAKYAKEHLKNILVVERWKVGGECTHYGCVPSKALLSLNKGESFNKIAEAVDKVEAIQKDILDSENIDVVQGMAYILSDNEVKVNETIYEANKIIVATGSMPVMPHIEGLAHIRYLTSKTVFNLKTVPFNLVVIGAGPIGIEIGYALKKLGANVTYLLRSDKILEKEDEEISEEAKKIFEKKGIRFINNTEIVKVENSKITYLDENKDQKEIMYNEFLVATGRKADYLPFKDLDVEYKNNRLVVDDYLRTSIKNIFVCGDVHGKFGLNNIAKYEGEIAAHNAIFEEDIKSPEYKSIVWTTYTSPEISHLGMTEDEAIAKYKDVKTYKVYFNEIDRAISDGKTYGFVKVVLDDTGYLLGASIIGERAGDIIQNFQLIKTLNVKLKDIDDMLYSYPVYSEVVKKVIDAVKKDN